VRPRRRIHRVLSLVLLLAAVASIPAPAAERWKFLDLRFVSDEVERDRFDVGIKKGRFSALQVRVDERAVEFRSMTVYFGNGETQSVELRDVIPAGGRSRAIALEGGQRAVSAVEFVYDAQSLGGGGAQVRLYGRR